MIIFKLNFTNHVLYFKFMIYKTSLQTDLKSLHFEILQGKNWKNIFIFINLSKKNLIHHNFVISCVICLFFKTKKAIFSWI